MWQSYYNTKYEICQHLAKNNLLHRFAVPLPLLWEGL